MLQSMIKPLWVTEMFNILIVMTYICFMCVYICHSSLDCLLYVWKIYCTKLYINKLMKLKGKIYMNVLMNLYTWSNVSIWLSTKFQGYSTLVNTKKKNRIKIMYTSWLLLRNHKEEKNYIKMSQNTNIIRYGFSDDNLWCFISFFLII